MACNMSSASAPRASPTTIRSGRIRNELRTRSRIRISPFPSMLGGRASRQSTCGCWSWSSFASSIVTIRSSPGMNDDKTFSKVVLPVPVPPLTTTLSRPRTQQSVKCATCSLIVFIPTRSSTVNGSARNRRIVRNGPPIARGCTMQFTRDPSGRRASTIGVASSTRRPTWLTILSMIRRRCSSSTKRTSVAVIFPSRSMNTCSGPFTMISLIPGSRSSRSIGPYPRMSSKTDWTSACRSVWPRARRSCAMARCSCSSTCLRSSPSEIRWS